MAKVYENDKKFLILEINYTEATKLNFGIKIAPEANMCICGSCNNICPENKIYYVACINETLCKDCVDDYVKNMTHYKDEDSITYELKHFSHYANRLGLNVNGVDILNAK